jgi:hypothetical protein
LLVTKKIKCCEYGPSNPKIAQSLSAKFHRKKFANFVKVFLHFFNVKIGANTLSIMTLSIMALSIMALSIMALSITTKIYVGA